MITLQDNEYAMLLDWAERGSVVDGTEGVFLAIRKKIDKANDITRYTMLIRYEELPQASFLGISEAPRGKTLVLNQLRPVTKADVLQALAEVRYIPNQVFVTADPLGAVGFYELDAYPWS